MGTQALPEAPGTDTFPINGTDYLEFYVGNAKQASLYYRTAFGFQLAGYRGPETGVRDRSSYLLVQDKLRFVLTSALGPEGEVAAHVRQHGDGVKDIAFWVDDAREAYAKAVARGAVPVHEPRVLSDADGEVVVAAIRTYGDTIHSIVERRGYRGLFLPGFKPVSPVYQPEPTGLKYVDHCVGNVELGKMNEWVGFYERVLGFFNLLSFDDKDISTEYSALMSKVMSNGNGRIKFPINEPAEGKKKSPDRGVPRLLSRARACSTSPSPPTTSSTPSASSGPAASSSCRSRRRTTRRVLERVGEIDEDLAPLRRARHPGRPRRRGLPAAALHQAGPGPARRSSTRSSSGRAPRASARATSRRCSSRSSASRRSAATFDGGVPMPIYHRLGQLPKKRHLVFRRPDGGLYAGAADGQRGLHRPRVAALPHPAAHHRQVAPAAGRDRLPGRSRPHASGTATSRPPGSPRAAAPPSTGSRSSSTTTSRCSSRGPAEATSTSTGTPRPTKWCT